jgi:hypothetical protein
MKQDETKIQEKIYAKIPFLFLFVYGTLFDRLCGLVVRVPGYRSRGPGSIPVATKFSEK